MHLPRSLLASATLLSFSFPAEAAVAQQRADSTNENALKERQPEQAGFFSGWSLHKFLGIRQESQDLVCSSDDPFWDMVNKADADDRQTVCNKLLEIAPATVVSEYTPVITRIVSSNSTSTVNSTTRIVVTATETAVTASPLLLPRGVNLAAKKAQANDIFTSILVDTTSSPASPTKTNNGREEAVSSMMNACSCFNVDPTSTMTFTYTAPPAQITVNKNRMRMKTNVVTKLYTTTTTLTQSSAESASQTVVSGSMLLSSAMTGGPFTASILASTNASSPAETLATSLTPKSNSSVANASTTGATSAIIITTNTKEPSTSVSGSIKPVATGIPFDCPGNNNARAQYIVGDSRWDYLILCDKAIITSNELFTMQVSSATDCAVECSLVNDRSKGACQAATFSATPDANPGDCLISGPAGDIVDRPGSVTVILAGLTTTGENCTSVDLTSGPSNNQIDKSSLKDAVTTVGVQLSIPGLLYRSETAGVNESFFSTGYTDSVGVYHWYWEKVWASSSAWLEAYASSYTCTQRLPPKTIVDQRHVTEIENVTSIIQEITTILNGNTITVISGTSTTSFTAGSGASTPPLIPASTTGSSGLFTTGGATATRSEADGSGAESPMVPSIPSGTASSQAGLNETSASASSIRIKGSETLTLSRALFTANSTSGQGALPPSSSQTDLSQLSTSPSSNVSTIETVTSGGAGVIISSATYTANSANTSGLIIPSATNATAISNATSSNGSTGPSFTSGGPIGTTSSTTIALNFTEGNGYGASTSAQTISTSSNSTGGPGTAISGGGQQTISRQTFTAKTTRESGIIPPVQTGTGSSELVLSAATSASNATSGSAAATSIPSLNQTATPPGSMISGGNLVTSAGNTSAFFSTNASGAIIPTTVTTHITSEVTVVVTTNVTSSTISTAGSDVSTISSGLTSINSTGASGTSIISLTSSIEAASSPNVTIASSGTPAEGGLNITSSGSASTASRTEESGVILPSGNSSIAVPPSPTPGPGFNVSGSANVSLVSATTGALNFSTARETTTKSTTATSGVISPSANVSSSIPSSIPIPSTNTSSTIAGTIISTSGALNLTVMSGMAVITTERATGIISTSLNSTATIPPSLTTTGLNASDTTTPFDFNNSDKNRSGSFSRTSSPNITLPSTAPTMAGTASIAQLNSTAPPGTEGLSTTEQVGYSLQPSASFSIPPSSANFTSISGTEQPSVNSLPPGVNSSSTLSVTDTDTFLFSNDDAGRRGSFSKSSSPSRSFPVPTANVTVWPGTSVASKFTPPLETASSTVPTVLVNSSFSILSSTGTSGTGLPLETEPSSFPVQSINTTVGTTAIPTPSYNASIAGTGALTVSEAIIYSSVIAGTGSFTPMVPANSSAGVGTGSSAIPTPSSGSSIELTTESSAPLTIPVISSNSTVVASTGASGLPAASANSSVLPTGYPAQSSGVPIAPSNSSLTIDTTPSAFPASSANTTIPLSIGLSAPSSATPIVSANSSLPRGTASNALPTPSDNFSNSDVNRGGRWRSSTVLPVSMNSTVFLPTGTGSFNATVTQSVIATAPPPPSVAPSNFSNSTFAEPCPTATGSTISVETILITHTLPLIPSTCVLSDSVSATGNITLPSGTGTGIVTSTPSSATPASARRLANTTATQEQIDASCADKANLIFNPGLEQEADNNAFGWTAKADDSFINFRTFPSDNQHTPDGHRSGRVLSAAPGRSVTISQPLTLCPGKQYRLSAFNRQTNILSQCTADYSIGGKNVFTASPQESWLQRSEFYTAGTTPEDVSVDLKIRVSCAGQGGAPVGTTDDGYMVADFDDVGLVQV